MLQISFEETSFANDEGSSVSIALRMRLNQNPFTVSFHGATIDSAVRSGLQEFILQEFILPDVQHKATEGNVKWLHNVKLLVDKV